MTTLHANTRNHLISVARLSHSWQVERLAYSVVSDDELLQVMANSNDQRARAAASEAMRVAAEHEAFAERLKRASSNNPSPAAASKAPDKADNTSDGGSWAYIVFIGIVGLVLYNWPVQKPKDAAKSEITKPVPVKPAAPVPTKPAAGDTAKGEETTFPQSVIGAVVERFEKGFCISFENPPASCDWVKKSCMVPVGDLNYKNTHTVLASELGEIKPESDSNGVSPDYVRVLGTQVAKAGDVVRCAVTLPPETQQARRKRGLTLD